MSEQLSPFRQAIRYFGWGDWRFVDGVLVRVGILAFCILNFALAVAADEPKPISARVHVTSHTQPGAFETFVRVTYSRDYIAYTVAGYCDGELTVQSTRQLDELSRAPEQPVVWRNLPGCNYLVVALLHGPGGKVVARTPAIPVTVLCFPCNGDD